MQLILKMHPMTLLLLGAAISWAKDIVCKKGRLSMRISVGEVDSFEFRTQSVATYAPKTICHVKYRKEASCPKMRFYCPEFNVNNKHINCKGKDKMEIRTPRTKRVYCGGKGPDVTTSAKYLKVSFISDKRKQSSAAVCRVECETTDAAMFHVFESKYNKIYSNQTEKVKRFKIWQQRTNLMKEDNKLYREGKKTYRKGENAMFDMTPEEIEANYMGLSLKPKVYSTKVSRVYIDISDFPSSINWTEKGRVTSVKNQAGCGSCWAHSAAGALEGAYKKDTNRLVNIDVSYLIDCITYGCKQYNPAQAFTYVMQNGIVIANETYRSTSNTFHNTQDIHFNESSGANEYIMNRKSQCTLENDNAVIIRGIWRINKGREDELMQAVAEIGPVSVLICAPMDLVDYAGEVFYEETCSEACNTSSHVNHAALVVGYGEQINKITNENESYWLVKNSWGTDWGDEGYIKMAKNRNDNCGIASTATYPAVWGDLICGEDLDTLLGAGENAELEIQCCDDGKIITCAGEECKTVCSENEPIECLRPVEEFENIEDCGAINRKIAQVKITGSYCKYRAPCPRLDGSNQYCSCCKYSYYYRRYRYGKGCAPRCTAKYCLKSAQSTPINHNETGSDLICLDIKKSYFSNLTEFNTSLTVLCCGRTTPRTCTGSDCSLVCGGDITCIKMVESMKYSGHCYDDVMLVLRTEDSCKFAPCPSIGNNTKFCKCCEFPSYNETCPETCSSCPPSTVQGCVPIDVIQSNSYGDIDGYYGPNMFHGKNVFTNSQDYRTLVTKTSNYWLSYLGYTGARTQLILSLDCTLPINGFWIKNTHNSGYQNAGTKAFSIFISEKPEGPWTKVLDASLKDARNVSPVPIETFNLPNKVSAKYVMFQVDSYYGLHGGLQYFSPFGNNVENEETKGNAILITGGWTSRTTTEVYFPSTNKGCSVRNYDLPVQTHTHTMNTFGNQTLLCGGGQSTETRNNCFEFSPNSLSSLSTVWPKYANLTEARYEHTSWVSSAGIVLIGGYGPFSAKSEYSAELVTGGILPFTFPLRVRDACAIGDASSDSFILTGGRYTQFKVTRYNLKGLVETLPNMNRAREWHGCGSYESAGKMVLIVAGGGPRPADTVDSTEKLVIGEVRWSLVGPLPRAMFMFASLNMDNKLYILGGLGISHESLRDILEYDADLEVWEKVGDMQMVRLRHAAAVIYADFMDLCN